MLTIEQTINLVTIYATLLGAIYMVKGFLSLSPIEILKSLPAEGAIVHSLKDITNVVRQRVESWIGITIVSLSAIIQVVIFLQTVDTKACLVSTKILWIIGVGILLVSLGSYHFCHYYTKDKVLQANKLYVINHLNTEARNNESSLLEDDFIISCVLEYFDMGQQSDESRTQFLERIYDFLEIDDPYKKTHVDNNKFEGKSSSLFEKLLEYLVPNEKKMGLYSMLYISFILLVFLANMNIKSEGWSIVAGVLQLGYFPFIYRVFLKDKSSVLFLEKDKPRCMYISLFLFILSMIFISWNILMGTNFIITAIVNIFEIEKGAFWYKIFVNGIGANVILIAPAIVMTMTMNYYKNNILSKDLAHCKTFSAWVLFFIAFIFLGNHYWEFEKLQNLYKLQDIWGVGLIILLFRALIEYYSTLLKPK